MEIKLNFTSNIRMLDMKIVFCLSASGVLCEWGLWSPEHWRSQHVVRMFVNPYKSRGERSRIGTQKCIVVLNPWVQQHLKLTLPPDFPLMWVEDNLNEISSSWIWEPSLVQWHNSCSQTSPIFLCLVNGSKHEYKCKKYRTRNHFTTP